MARLCRVFEYHKIGNLIYLFFFRKKKEKWILEFIYKLVTHSSQDHRK